MTRALGFAGVTPDQVGYVNCHAASTPVGDVSEASAVRNVFMSGNKKDIAISSTKGATGHAQAAAGAIESIFTVLACHSGMLPPTVNLDNPDPRVSDINIISGEAKNWEVRQKRRIAVKNSFGLGGTNGSLCFASFEN
jgi:3-oxoacyl-[acyl-carrier-protein] synthase II